MPGMTEFAASKIMNGIDVSFIVHDSNNFILEWSYNQALDKLFNILKLLHSTTHTVMKPHLICN